MLNYIQFIANKLADPNTDFSFLEKELFDDPTHLNEQDENGWSILFLLLHRLLVLPGNLKCPITNKLIEDPVAAPDGRIYEKEAIEDWVQNNGYSPVTYQSLSLSDLEPDPTYHLRLIELSKKEQFLISIINKLLKQEDINVNLKLSNDKTALMYATQLGNLKLVKLLIKKGAKLDSQDNLGNTALLLAVTEKNYKIVTCLARNNASLNKFDCAGSNALLLAIYKNDVQMVRLLIQLGVDIKPNFHIGKKLWFFALEHGCKDIVELLVREAESFSLLASQNRAGAFALMYAVQSNDEKWTNWLLNCGASVNQQTKDLWTVQMLAALNGHAGIFWLVYQNVIFIDQKNLAGYNAFQLAVINQRTKVLDILTGQKESKPKNHVFKSLDLYTLLRKNCTSEQKGALSSLITKAAKQPDGWPEVWSTIQAINGFFTDKNKKIIWINQTDLGSFISYVRRKAEKTQAATSEPTKQCYYLAVATDDQASVNNHHAACYVEVDQDGLVKVLVLDAAENRLINSFFPISEEAVQVYIAQANKGIQKTAKGCRTFTFYHLLNLMTTDHLFEHIDSLSIVEELDGEYPNCRYVDWACLPLAFLVNVQSKTQWDSYVGYHKRNEITPEADIEKLSSLRATYIKQSNPYVNPKYPNDPLPMRTKALWDLQENYLQILNELIKGKTLLAFARAGEAWQFNLLAELAQENSALLNDLDLEENNILHYLFATTNTLVSEVTGVNLFAEAFKFIDVVLAKKPDLLLRKNMFGKHSVDYLFANTKLSEDFKNAFKVYYKESLTSYFDEKASSSSRANYKLNPYLIWSDFANEIDAPALQHTPSY